MTESSLALLKKVVKEVNESKTMPEKIEALSKAFELFTEETSRLEKAYAQLKEQFEFVNRQLEDTNSKLKEKVLELDITTDYLENILSNMSQGLLFIGSNGIVTTYNAVAENLLGYPKSEVLFHDFRDVFGDCFFGFSISEALESADAPQVNYLSLSADDHNPNPRELEIDTTFVIKSDPRVKNHTNPTPLDISMGLIILLRDITEIRRLQTIADRNDRMKELGEMAAMVAHEIRNPLGGIKGFASLLVRDLKDNPKLQEMATYIVEGTDSLNKLVTNILNYSRPLLLDLEPTDLCTLMKDLVKHVRVDSLVKENIDITVEAPSKPIVATIDFRIIKSAVLNLIVNSIHAMPKGGQILIRLKSENGHALIQVEDTGEGISEENIAKIFRPFFTTKPHGHGFGLAEVHRIIQAHEGSIEVKSTVGKGTVFTIKLPLSKTES